MEQTRFSMSFNRILKTFIALPSFSKTIQTLGCLSSYLSGSDLPRFSAHGIISSIAMYDRKLRANAWPFTFYNFFHIN